MAKNIVILFDGTSNEIKEDRTNVLRLYGTLKKGPAHVVWYDPGVGTFGRESPLSSFYRKFWDVYGLMTGYGLDDNVKEAYRFLVENYEVKKAGTKTEARDSIYIFGFSRGAYSARVLAGFINAFGLMEPRNLNLLDYAYRAYKRIGENPDDDSFAEMRLYERVIRADRPPIRFLGLFDTVASVIERGPFLWRIRSHAFTKSNVSVQTVRHAVAIAERRCMFRPKLWPGGGEYWGNPFTQQAAVPQDVKEVWFAGVHGDVGGGYPEDESALAKVPLDWMIREAKEAGVEFVPQTVNMLVRGTSGDKHVRPDPAAEPHDSMTGLWPLLEFLPQRKQRGSRRASIFGWTLPFFEPRWIGEGATLHRSASERYVSGPKPENLPASFEIED